MLVSLGPQHERSLERFLEEFDAQGGELHGYFCERDWPIEKISETLEAWSRGEGIEPNWVPNSTWFWEAEGVLEGVINLRHRLTPQLERNGGHIGYSVAPSHRRKGVATRMLAGALEHCRALGIEQALLTCDTDNPGSWKAIEANGGKLAREDWEATTKRTQRWYWIEVP